jgi:hypothetical protein
MAISITSADERGLHGISLEIQLRSVFASLSSEQIREIARDIHAESERRELVYLRDGKIEVINVMMRPIGIFSEQMNYYHYASQTLLGALKRLPELYIRDFKIRELVPLDESEARWLWDTWTSAHSQFHTVFGRLDAIADMSTAFPKEGLFFIEPNLEGVGGVHLVPTSEQIILDVVMPVIQRVAPELRLEAPYDLRELFIQELIDHAESIGRKSKTICLIDPKYAGDGPNEQESLGAYYTSRGYQVFHADPEELYMRRGDVYYENHLIDVAYRDYETRELAEMEREGANVQPMKQLFRNNQMVSSIAGDFDHKSCFEVLTDPQFAQYFTMDERNVFRRHVLWTRLLSARRTTNELGELIDLVEYIRNDKDHFVIKPNRSYGGDRVLIGPSVSQSEWDEVIEQSLKEPGVWVVQQIAKIPGYEFPVITENQEVATTPFYVVVGLAPTKYGLCILGRASQKQVVNVAQRGGMVAVLVGKHSPHVYAPMPAT